MPRTHRSGRGARVAAVMRADRPRSTSSVAWASARRWLVVAGLLSGAWFAGAACAAADESGPVAALADDAGVQQEHEGQESGQDLAGAVEGAAPAATGGDSGGSASDDSRGHPGGAHGESNADSGPAASGEVDAAAADPVGAAADADTVDSASAAATGADGSANPASSPAQQRPEGSAVRPNEKRDRAAVERLGDTVAAVGEVGGSAGRTVPVSVSHPQTPDPAAVVSEAAAATAGDRADGLPGLGLDGFAPSDVADAVTLPAFELGQADGSSDTGRASAPGAESATRGHVDAPTTAGPESAHHAPAAFADYTGPAAYDGSTDSSGGPDAEPNALGADRADAAAVGSAVNISQSGGMCAGYLPAAASAAPAAGSLQCARQALADVPRDLGERPTFSPD